VKLVTADCTPLYAMTETDVKNFIKWSFAMRDKTQFDMSVMNHPRMCMTRALMDGEPSLYIPLQPVLMFDVLTPDPELTTRQRAICMYRIGELLETHIMPDTQMYDAYFYTNDEREVSTCSNHGWKEIEGVHLMRKRIKPPVQSIDREP
jgi:hypothetical protein